VHQAVTDWAKRLAQRQPGVLRVGYFGSYSRGDWGVGSDLDLVVILDAASAPFGQRSLELDLASIPVPVDPLIYSEKEWQDLVQAGGKFIRALQAEAVWVYDR
jgi:predicted nucleotidyltransferase